MNGASERQVQTVEDAAAVAQEAARRVIEAGNQALASHQFFTLALSGGATPKPMYEQLASPQWRDRLDWTRVQVFFSDERFVPADSPDSNYGLARDFLLSHLPIPERFVHPVPTEGTTPAEAAALYADAIQRVFHTGDAETPMFDLILLGLGPDGHTASLFPNTAALTASDNLVVANYVPAQEAWRVTFTFRLINTAKRVLLMAAGEEKAAPVRKILVSNADLPAGRVAPQSGELTWLLDKQAAAPLAQNTNA